MGLEKPAGNRHRWPKSFGQPPSRVRIARNPAGDPPQRLRKGDVEILSAAITQFEARRRKGSRALFAAVGARCPVYSRRTGLARLGHIWLACACLLCAGLTTAFSEPARE